jgi:hypothetical protein
MGRTQQDNKRTAGVGSSRTGSTSASQHKFGYGYEQQQQQQQPAQQLGDFFTAMSLKVPQRYGECSALQGLAGVNNLQDTDLRTASQRMNFKAFWVSATLHF